MTVADFIALARHDRSPALARGRQALAALVSGDGVPDAHDAQLGGVATRTPGGADLTLGLRPQGRMLELIVRRSVSGASQVADVVMIDPASQDDFDAVVARGVRELAAEMRRLADLDEPYSPAAAELAAWLSQEP